MKVFICSAKKLILHSLSNGKLLKIFEGWGVEILDAMRVMVLDQIALVVSGGTIPVGATGDEANWEPVTPSRQEVMGLTQGRRKRWRGGAWLQSAV